MWKQHLTNTLKDLVLQPSIMDNALFYNSNQLLFLHIYVDNGLIVDCKKPAILFFLSKLQEIYCIKIKEKPTQHLGYGIEWKTNSIFIHHQNYVNKILQEFTMQSANAIKAPLPTNALHLVNAKAKPFDLAMGYINYLAMHTRPNISFACNLLSQCSSKPTHDHWTLTKHLLCYFKGTSKRVIEISNHKNPRA
jgi:hypothetical protein